MICLVEFCQNAHYFLTQYLHTHEVVTFLVVILYMNGHITTGLQLNSVTIFTILEEGETDFTKP